MDRVTVLIAEENPCIRLGINRELCSLGIQHIHEVSTSAELLNQIEFTPPDILILSEPLSNECSVEFIENWRENYPKMKIIVVSSCMNEQILFAFLKAGVNGYLFKHDVLEETGIAVRTIIKGRSWISQRLVEKVMNRVLNNESHYFLSSREIMILSRLSEGKREKDIARSLNIAERTLRYNLKAIFTKIGVENKTEAVVWAVNQRLVET